MRIPSPRAEARRDPAARGRRGGRGAVAALAAALLLSGCGGGEPEARAPIARETAKDQILRIGREWACELQDRGFRSPPSRIVMFTARVSSRLVFDPLRPGAKEVLFFDETFQLGDGTSYRCQTRAETPVTARFGDHADEAAVEVARPALRLPRICATPGFPEPTLELEATAARFALRGDRLVPFAPPKERRQYIPAP